MFINIALTAFRYEYSTTKVFEKKDSSFSTSSLSKKLMLCCNRLKTAVRKIKGESNMSINPASGVPHQPGLPQPTPEEGPHECVIHTPTNIPSKIVFTPMCPFRVSFQIQEESVLRVFSPNGISLFHDPQVRANTFVQCIGGYSKGTSTTETIQKILYRVRQYWSSYPDWTDTREVLRNQLTLSGDSELNEQIRNGSVCRYVKISEADGEELLKSIIHKNDEWISRGRPLSLPLENKQ
jgi:hypothetical protein